MSTNNMAASRRQANDVIAPGWSGLITVCSFDVPIFFLSFIFLPFMVNKICP